MIPLHRVKNNGKVEIWDLGPQVEPKPPAAPIEPDATKLKGAEFAAATVEYEDACERYKSALRTWTASRKAHFAWADDKGGPIKIEMWGVDARWALEKEPARYKLDLPKGARPGKAQIEADERAAVEIEELKRARALDPQFGAGALQ